MKKAQKATVSSSPSFSSVSHIHLSATMSMELRPENLVLVEVRHPQNQRALIIDRLKRAVAEQKLSITITRQSLKQDEYPFPHPTHGENFLHKHYTYAPHLNLSLFYCHIVILQQSSTKHHISIPPLYLLRWLTTLPFTMIHTILLLRGTKLF